MDESLAYLLCAGRSVQDISTKKFSYIDVFSIIFLPKEISETLQIFWVAGKIMGLKTGNISLDIELEDPDGVVISTATLSGSVNEGELEFSAFFSLVKFSKIGKHFIRAKLNERKMEDGNRWFIKVLKAT